LPRCLPLCALGIPFAPLREQSLNLPTIFLSSFQSVPQFRPPPTSPAPVNLFVEEQFARFGFLCPNLIFSWPLRNKSTPIAATPSAAAPPRHSGAWPGRQDGPDPQPNEPKSAPGPAHRPRLPPAVPPTGVVGQVPDLPWLFSHLLSTTPNRLSKPIPLGPALRNRCVRPGCRRSGGKCWCILAGSRNSQSGLRGEQSGPSACVPKPAIIQERNQ